MQPLVLWPSPERLPFPLPHLVEAQPALADIWGTHRVGTSSLLSDDSTAEGKLIPGVRNGGVGQRARLPASSHWVPWKHPSRETGQESCPASRLNQGEKGSVGLHVDFSRASARHAAGTRSTAR